MAEIGAEISRWRRGDLSPQAAAALKLYWLNVRFCPPRHLPDDPAFDPAPAVFGFAQFGVAVSLLIVVYNSSDALYKFRISIAPIPLRPLTFASIALIGFGTLVIDLWFANAWLAPAWGVTRSSFQGLFGFWFLAIVLIWTWFAFVRPARFGPLNALAFGRTVFGALLRGNDNELAAVAVEVARSSNELITFASARPRRKLSEEQINDLPQPTAIAFDTLVALANRKFCRHVVMSSPGTAINLMQDAIEQKAFAVPLGAFAGNVTAEALKNTDSVLYHEDRLYDGLLGQLQPFSIAMYGDYRLVEGASNGLSSALNVHYEFAWRMSAEQFDAYCRIALITFKSYLAANDHDSELTPRTLRNVLETIKNCGLRSVHELDGTQFTYENDAARKLRATVSFVNDVIAVLEESDKADLGPLKISERLGQRTIYDHVATLLFDVILAAASVRSPPDTAWWIHHNMIWSDIRRLDKQRAFNVVRFKLFRLLYDEIRELEKWPNYQSSRVLGYCLNVLGFRPTKRTDYNAWQRPLQCVVLAWTKRNYVRLIHLHSPVAEHCMFGSISYDAMNERLVKTYSKGLRLEPAQDFFPLDPPAASDLKSA